METFEDQFVVLERGGGDETVVDDADDGIVETMAGASNRKKFASGEEREDVEEELWGGLAEFPKSIDLIH
jgi:hypothetical protein